LDNIKTIHSAARFIEITSAQVNQRIDNFLIKTLKTVPRSRIYRIIRKGEVRINKKRCKPDYKLQLADSVRIPPIYQDATDSAELYIPHSLITEIDQSVLFENKHFLVINKPAGIAVHSGSGIRYGVIDIMRRLRSDQDIELVHRLDRGTSGCLLLAKHRQSLLQLQKLLQSNQMNKIYHAVVKGTWDQSVKTIRHPLLKKTLSNGEKRMMVNGSGQKAQSEILRNEKFEDFSFLTIQLITGRTHQIRVHCQAEGHEIAGDDKYGDRQFNQLMKKRCSGRLMLHASRLEIEHNPYCDDLVINAPLPVAFKKLSL